MRLAHGIAAADFCREVGASAKAYSQWENGNRLLDVLFSASRLVAVMVTTCLGRP